MGVPVLRKIALLGLLLLGVSPTASADDRFPDVAALRAEIIKRMSGDPRFRKLAPDPVRPAGYRVVVIRDGEETEIDADLTNLFGYIEDGATSSRAEELIATHIGAVASVASSHEGQTELLVANIRSADELKQMQTSSTPGTSNAFMADPFVGDLAVIYQYDLPTTLSIAHWTEFPGRPRDELRKIAIGNLSKWLSDVSEDDSIGDSFPLFTIDGNPSLTPGLALLPEFWRPLEKRFPGGMLVILPRRDQLFVIDKRVESAARKAKIMIEVTWKEGFALLSNQLFERKDGALRPYAE